MKTIISIIIMLLTASGISLAQQTQVSWSSFNNGFGVTGSTTTKIQSQLGMPMIGSNQQGSTAVGSGFLPNPVVFQAPCNYACIRVYAEGPMNTGTGLMDNALKTSGILAAHFPGKAIPAAAVDSISVELRNAAVNPTMRMVRPAWLLTDGTIRAFNDTSDHYVEFDTLPGAYYLAIHHRNHLAIMTPVAQALMGTVPPAYDFTTSQNQAYGTNPMKLVGTKYCMYAGDANASAIVTTADANGVFSSLLASGYNSNDINLSGVVSTADANIIFTNLLVGSQVTSPVRNPEEITPAVISKSQGKAGKDSR